MNKKNEVKSNEKRTKGKSITGIDINILENNENLVHLFNSMNNDDIEQLESPYARRMIARDKLIKIREHICSSELVKVNKRTGDTIINFNDGTIEKYGLNDIFEITDRDNVEIIDRLSVTLAAYSKLYFKKDPLDEFSRDDFVNEEEYNNICTIDKFIKDIYTDNFGSDGTKQTIEKRAEDIKMIYIICMKSDFSVYIYTLENLRRLYGNSTATTIENKPIATIINKYIDEMEKDSKELLEQLNHMDNEKFGYQFIKELIGKDTNIIITFKSKYGGKSLSDEAVINVLVNTLGEDGLKDFLSIYITELLERKNVVKYIIDKRIMTEQEIKASINKRKLKDLYLKSGNKEYLKYMDKTDIVELYTNNYIDFNTFKRYADLKAVLLSNINKDKKVEILTGNIQTTQVRNKKEQVQASNKKRVFQTMETDIIWELFEYDYLSIDDVKKLELCECISKDEIINLYEKDKKRKIAAELGIIPAVTDSKIYEFFSPEVALEDMSSEKCSDSKQAFYNNDLKRIYKEREKDLEIDVSHLILSENENSKRKSDKEHLDLYKKGFLSAETLKKAGLSEEAAMEYYNNNNYEPKILIDFFNNGIISQDTIMEIYDDDFDTEVFNLISNGMNPNVIAGLYSTYELIEKVRGEKETKRKS